MHTKVYTKHREYALANGEMERFTESLNQNVSCAAAIDEAIQRHFNYLQLDYEAVTSAIEAFGKDRVYWVLANTIRHMKNDTQISPDNKVWADIIRPPLYRQSAKFVLKSPPAVIDAFVRLARSEKVLAIVRQREGGKSGPTGVAAEETPLFYSSREPGRDQETGCIGHFRADFGRDGKGFYTSWEDHCPELKTQAFKDEFDSVINTLREGVLKDRATLTAYCHAHPQAKLDDGRDYNYGFKTKTDSHVYYLRCCTLQTDYNLYAYAYERGRLEKCFPSLADNTIGIGGELQGKLEKAAEYIIETSARETTSGNYIVSVDDIPADILEPELFSKHIDTIAEVMLEYTAVAEADVLPDGSIDTLMYLAYCPNFEPDAAERDDYPPDREILDPIKSRRVPEKDTPTVAAVKPTLAEKLEANKQKAARQGRSDAHKTKNGRFEHEN